MPRTERGHTAMPERMSIQDLTEEGKKKEKKLVKNLLSVLLEEISIVICGLGDGTTSSGGKQAVYKIKEARDIAESKGSLQTSLKQKNKIKT